MMQLQELFNVKDKVIVVTGGARGVGRHASDTLVSNGATVIMISRSTSTGESAAKTLNEMGPGKAYFITADLSNMSQIKTLPDQISALGFSKIDGLINNSGIITQATFKTFSENDWDSVMDVNLKAIFFLTQALLPFLEASASFETPARIINISSITSIRPSEYPIYSYETAKSALNFLSTKLASEFALKFITVNVVVLGLFETDMSSDAFAPREDGFSVSDTIPLRRGGTREDISGVMLWLLSRAGAYVTGTTINVDGGSLSNSASLRHSSPDQIGTVAGAKALAELQQASSTEKEPEAITDDVAVTGDVKVIL